jgi:hypothetical protein
MKSQKRQNKFQNYLQKNQKFFQQLNNFELKRDQNTQDVKKNSSVK